MLTGGRAANTAGHLQQMQQQNNVNYGDHAAAQSGFLHQNTSPGGQPQLSRDPRDPRNMPQPPGASQGGTLSQHQQQSFNPHAQNAYGQQYNRQTMRGDNFKASAHRILDVPGVVPHAKAANGGPPHNPT